MVLPNILAVVLRTCHDAIGRHPMSSCASNPVSQLYQYSVLVSLSCHPFRTIVIFGSNVPDAIAAYGPRVHSTEINS